MPVATPLNATSTILRVFAFQTGFALWLVLFSFLLYDYLSIDPATLMPGFYGNRWFDIARFVITALVSGFFVESIYIDRTASSQANTTVLYASLLFVLPYFHHYFGNLLVEIVGTTIMLLVLGFTHFRLATHVHEWYERRLMNILGIPILAIALGTILDACRTLTPKVWNWYCGTIASWELPIYYSSIVMIGVISLACAIHDAKSWRSVLMCGLVTLHGALWWNCIVKPF